MQSIRYPSSDGLEIPAYLTIPTGKEAKGLPLVVLVHGGPKGPRDYWGYNPEAQFLANRGYAVLQPNFRSSGGYGKSFLNAGDLQWGKLAQDDLSWGVKHLVAEGIADASRVAIMGGSYGGYATLAGLAFTPELYACGVDIVGPSNIATLLESVPAYWEAGRAFLYGMVGDPNTEEGKALIREASPLFKADRIVRPLLIVQGANDPRVKQAEADQIVIALRDRGHDVSYLLAEDEGHGFAKPVNKMAMYAEVERFLGDKLGGRYQTEMPEDVAKRLEELRVDIDSVTYAAPSAFKVAASLPELTPSFSEGEEDWDVKIAVQGQEMPMRMQRKYSRAGENWVIADEVSGPMGKISDAVTYSNRLRPVSRKLTQGPANIEATYETDRIDISANGNQTSLDVNGALLCDGPGREAIIAAITWKDGAEFVVLTPSLASQKMVTVKMRAAGTETVDGVDCLKVTVSDTDNTAAKATYWLDPKSKKVIRSEQIVPELGNAVLSKTLKR